MDVSVSKPAGRHVPIGHGGFVHPAFWVAALALAVAMRLRLPVGGPGATLAAVIVFLGGGLPHGAFDIALLRRVVSLDRWRSALVVGGYIAVAGAMAVMWLTTPLPALILFLAIAAVHFGEDWRMLDEPLLRAAAGGAVIAAPTIGHPGEVAALFVAIGGPDADMLARLIIAAAPVALLVTAVGIGLAWRGGDRGWAAAMGVCLALLLIVPPVAGFALFFVFLHSPLHLAQTRGALRDMTRARWLATGAILSTAALLGWWALHAAAGQAIGGDLTAQAFRLLASVAVPHLLLSRWMERRLAASPAGGFCPAPGS